MRLWIHQPGGAGTSQVGMVHCPAPHRHPRPCQVTPHWLRPPHGCCSDGRAGGRLLAAAAPEPFPTNSKAQNRPLCFQQHKGSTLEWPECPRVRCPVRSWWGGALERRRYLRGEGLAASPQGTAVWTLQWRRVGGDAGLCSTGSAWGPPVPVSPISPDTQAVPGTLAWGQGKALGHSSCLPCT